jgi:hypothetical protein
LTRGLDESSVLNDCGRARAEEVTDRRLWHPWLRINRLLRAMLHTRWSAEAWSQVRIEFKKALALRSQIRRAGGSTSPMADPRGGLLVAALGFAGCSMPSYDRALWALRSWLDSWSGVGHVAIGMHRQGFDLQLTRYDERGWRATFYTTGMEHSPTSATGTGSGSAVRNARVAFSSRPRGRQRSQ